MTAETLDGGFGRGEKKPGVQRLRRKHTKYFMLPNGERHSALQAKTHEEQCEHKSSMTPPAPCTGKCTCFIFM